MAGRLRVSPVTVYRYEKSSQVPKADTLTLLLDLAKELG
jgi:transcriptional regulator with XRE-family HTH domain